MSRKGSRTEMHHVNIKSNNSRLGKKAGMTKTNKTNTRTVSVKAAFKKRGKK